MSNLIRWEPAREMMTLRDAMDRLFDDAFTRPLRLNDSNWSMPTVDMYQTDNEVVVKAAILVSKLMMCRSTSQAKCSPSRARSRKRKK